MPYSSNTSIAPRTFSTGGGSIKLSIGTGGGNYIKSVSPKAVNIFNQLFVLKDNVDKFRELLAFETTGRGLNSGGTQHTGSVRSTSMVICNEGDQPSEIRLSMYQFATSTDVKHATPQQPIIFLLNPSEFIYLPHNQIFRYGTDDTSLVASNKSHTASSGTSADFVDPDSASRPDSRTRISAGLISSAVLIDNVSNHASGDTTLTVDSNFYFKVNDVIGIIKDGTSTHEYLRILDVPSATTLTVERAVLGSTAGQLNNDTDIRLYYLNEVNDTVLKTNSNGRYSANTFCGYGRSRTENPQGVQRGSVSVRVREPAYQEFGMSGQGLSTSTGLTVSTSYDFDLVVDGHSNYQGVFTTDSSNVRWGGVSGILSKINSLFETAYKAGTFTHLPILSIANGDIRLTSGSRLSTSAVTLADGTGAGTNMLSGSAGRIPNVDNFITRSTKFPETYETGKMIFDDGNGNLSGGQGNGKIDYETGGFSLNTHPDSQFEISCYHSTAMSGSMQHNTNTPSIESVHARSMNPFRDAKIRVISFDPEEGDPRSATATSQSGSGSGKR